MPQQLYTNAGSGCGGGSEGVRHVSACPALTGTFNLNMKGSDVPTLSVAPCSRNSVEDGPSCFFYLTSQPSRITL